MEKTITKISEVENQIDIFISSEEFKPFYDKIFSQVKNSADIKGFRKGKVPPNLVKQMYGKFIEKDAIEDLIEDVLNKMIKEDKIKIIGDPKIDNFEKKDDGFAFVIKYETIPTFELQEYRGITINEPIHNVTEDEIDAEIENLCRMSGKVEEAEQILDEYFITDVTINELDPSTHVPIIGAKEQTDSIYLAHPNVPPDIKRSLLNAKVGDVVHITLPKVNDDAQEQLLAFTVNGIRQIIPAEFTNEFVQTTTNNELVSTEELREEVGFKLQDKYNQQSRESMESQVKERLVEAHGFLELPEVLVLNASKKMAENFLTQYNKKKKPTDAEINTAAENFKPFAEKTLRWELIEEKIIEQEQLQIEDYDLDPVVEDEAKYSSDDPETIRTSLKSNQNVIDNLLSKKVIDLLIDYAITREVNFDGTEFNPDLEEHIHDENCDHDHGEEHIHDENCDHD